MAASPPSTLTPYTDKDARFANLDATGALIVTGASTLTGAATLSSTLAVTGASTFTGAATFNGGAKGGWQNTVEAAAADGAVAIASKTVYITKAGVCALTLAAPTATTHDGIRITFISTTANAHTVTATTIGFNALNASGDVGTFGGAVGDGFTVEAYQGEWYVVPGSNLNVTIA